MRIRFFSYFTDLSYIGLISYLWASAVQTLVYAFRRDGTFPLQRWPRFLQFLHILLYSTITTFRAYPILQCVCRLLRCFSSHSNHRDSSLLVPLIVPDHIRHHLLKYISPIVFIQRRKKLTFLPKHGRTYLNTP